MDGRQFDQIARSLGSGTTRRSIIKGMAAGLIAAIAGGRTIAHATVEICGVTGDECTVGLPEESGCCITHYCDEQSSTCVEHACVFEGQQCGGVFIAEESEREPNFFFSCCEGLVCNDSTGVCEATGPVCAVEGETCGEVVLAGEGSEVICCEGFVCNEESKCAPPPVICAAEKEMCDELDCCGDLTCLDTGYCGYPKTKPEEPVKPAPAPVPVVQLPDTGAGEGASGSEWIIPAALGAAAAAVAGRKLLANDGTTSGDPI